MTVRIVVADQAAARMYDMNRFEDKPRLFDELTDPAAHLHDRDFKSDRPGRVFDHAPSATGRRGAVAHHSTGGERTPRKHEAGVFAARIADALEAARRDGQFQALVLMAPPAFLGALREALPKSVKALVTAEVAKDLVHQGEKDLLAHIPREAFPVYDGPRG